MTTKEKKYPQTQIRGIDREQWLEIRGQALKEGCKNIGEYILECHREHIENIKKGEN